MSKQTHTIVLIENYWHGFFQIVSWLGVLALAMGFAVWIDSAAMQWVMAGIWLLLLMAIVNQQTKRLTIEQAHDLIAALKAEKDASEEDAAA